MLLVYQSFTNAGIGHRQVLQLLSQRAHDEGVAHIILLITAILRFPWLRAVLCMVLGVPNGSGSARPTFRDRKCFKCGSATHEVKDCPSSKDDDSKDSGGPARHKPVTPYYNPYGNSMG